MGVTILQTRATAEGLNLKQLKALPLILAGMSGKAVAEEVGVLPQTVSHWLHHSPPFMNALATEKEASLDRARRLLAANAVQAAETLIATSKSGSGSANTTKASQLILDRVGIVGPTEGGLNAAGVDPQTQALVTLILARRAEKDLSEVQV